jgi:hypothetical protein
MLMTLIASADSTVAKTGALGWFGDNILAVLLVFVFLCGFGWVVYYAISRTQKGGVVAKPPYGGGGRKPKDDGNGPDDPVQPTI